MNASGAVLYRRSAHAYRFERFPGIRPCVAYLQFGVFFQVLTDLVAAVLPATET